MSNTSEYSPSTSPNSTQPPNSTELTLSIDAIHDQYQVADAFSREVSNFREDVAIPSHNELRYAGHHAIQAWVASGDERASHMTKARNHCQRSMYEAADAGIMSALEMIGIFKDDYKNVLIGETVSNYLEIKGRARQAKQLLADRRNHNPDDMIDAKPYVLAFRALVKDCDALEDAREELNKSIRKDAKDGKKWLIGIVLTAAALAVGIFAHPILVERFSSSSSADAATQSPRPKPMRP